MTTTIKENTVMTFTIGRSASSCQILEKRDWIPYEKMTRFRERMTDAGVVSAGDLFILRPVTKRNYCQSMIQFIFRDDSQGC